MMRGWSFQSQSHLKAQKKRSVSTFVHVKHFLYIRHSHKKHVEVVLKMHCHRIYKHGDINTFSKTAKVLTQNLTQNVKFSVDFIF